MILMTWQTHPQTSIESMSWLLCGLSPKDEAARQIRPTTLSDDAKAPHQAPPALRSGRCRVVEHRRSGRHRLPRSGRRDRRRWQGGIGEGLALLDGPLVGLEQEAEDLPVER